MKPHRVIVTGGCGFIGSHLVKRLLDEGHTVLNLDNLTYAAKNCKTAGEGRYHFKRMDIANPKQVAHAMHTFAPSRVMHLAAESHVDRSIAKAQPFIHTNIQGTAAVLDAVLDYINVTCPKDFSLTHISTDEVYGSTTKPIKVGTAYNPSSPYSASKAAADHLVRAWHVTHGTPYNIVIPTNNYGSGQHVEKLIPTVIRLALEDLPIPIYGDGMQFREWLHVDDHVDMLMLLLDIPATNSTLHVGSGDFIRNLILVGEILILVEELTGKARNSIKHLVSMVEDRKGHDTGYAVDYSGTTSLLKWSPKRTVHSSLREVVQSYIKP